VSITPPPPFPPLSCPYEIVMHWEPGGGAPLRLRVLMYSNASQKLGVVRGRVPLEALPLSLFFSPPSPSFQRVNIFYFDMWEFQAVFCLSSVRLFIEGSYCAERRGFNVVLSASGWGGLDIGCRGDMLYVTTSFDSSWHSVDKHLQKSRQYTAPKI